tara:strand:+ start:912 stop:1055 length:144 start_codon:yes stop_codon:yes gene_type:complete
MKRDEVLGELKELHKRFWSSGFTLLTSQEYEAEVKRLRFRWLTYYDI